MEKQNSAKVTRWKTTGWLNFSQSQEKRTFQQASWRWFGWWNTIAFRPWGWVGYRWIRTQSLRWWLVRVIKRDEFLSWVGNVSPPAKQKANQRIKRKGKQKARALNQIWIDQWTASGWWTTRRRFWNWQRHWTVRTRLWPWNLRA